MSRNFILCILILACGLWLGRRLDARIDKTSAANVKLSQQTASKGIMPSGHNTRSKSRKNLAQQTAEAKRLVAEYLKSEDAKHFIFTPGKIEKSDVGRQIETLNTRQMTIFLTDVLAAMGNDTSIDADRVAHMLRELTRKDPQGALTLYLAHRDVLRRGHEEDGVVSDAIYQWASKDPRAAATWMKDHVKECPEAMSVQSLANLFFTAARVDLNTAIDLVSFLELDEKMSSLVFVDIVSTPRTNEDRNKVLAIIRDCKAGKMPNKNLPKAADHAFAYIQRSFKKNDEGFEPQTAWLAEANLNDEELDQYLSMVVREHPSANGMDESRKWIEWLGENAPENRNESYIFDLMSGWTMRDHKSAEAWLRDAPDGLAKQKATCGYAFTMAEYDLPTAEAWIETLSDEAQRTKLCKTIHRNLPKETPTEQQAAADFAAKHGID